MSKKKLKSSKNPFDNNIIPIQFFIKFDPPLIAMLYKRGPKDNKKHIYNIILNGLVEIMDPIEITKQLFIEHPNYLQEKYFEQICGLVEKILIELSQDVEMNEEEIQQQYQELIEQGYSHQEVLEIFRQNGIELDMNEDEDEEEALYQQQMHQQYLQLQQMEQQKQQQQMKQQKQNKQAQKQEQPQVSEIPKKGRFGQLREMSQNR